MNEYEILHLRCIDEMDTTIIEQIQGKEVAERLKKGMRESFIRECESIEEERQKMNFNMQSEQINELNSAIIKAKTEFGKVTKNQSSINNRYKYATLETILDAIDSGFSKNGLDLKQLVTDIEDKRYLYTRIDHISGQFMQTRIEIDKPRDCLIYDTSGKNMLQGYGSQLTYLKRYTLAAFLGIASEEDTDAQELVVPENKIDSNNKPKYEYQSRKISEKQVNLYNNLIKGKDIEHEAILNQYKIDKIEDLDAASFNTILNVIDPEKSRLNKK